MDAVLDTRDCKRIVDLEEFSKMNGPICPIRDCESYTQRMEKHLSTCHAEFTENQINCAKKYLFSREILMRAILMTKEQTQFFFETSHSLTDDPNLRRKFSYKLGTLCSRLFKNMSDHISNVQKVTKKDQNYLTYVNVPIVPGFLTKKK